MDTEKIALTIRDTIRDLPKRYSLNSERISETEKETDDLMHLLELTKFNAVEGYKISKQLQTIRQERRILKDENDLLRPMIHELKNMKNKLNTWDNILGNIRREKARKENRYYNCKYRKDLQDKINGVKM